MWNFQAANRTKNNHKELIQAAPSIRRCARTCTEADGGCSERLL